MEATRSIDAPTLAGKPELAQQAVRNMAYRWAAKIELILSEAALVSLHPQDESDAGRIMLALADAQSAALDIANRAMLAGTDTEAWGDDASDSDVASA